MPKVVQPLLAVVLPSVLVLTGLSACTGDSRVAVYNAPPTAAILGPVDGTTIDENTALLFEGRVSDDGGPAALEVQWTSDKDGLLSDTSVPEPDGRVEYTTANLTPGNHVIGLRVLDEEGLQAAATISVVVIDLPEPPEIDLISPSQGEEVLELEDFRFEAVVEDAQDDPETLEVVFLSDRDGFLCAAMVNAAGGARCDQMATVGTHLITSTVTDSDGNDAEATAYLKVIALADVDGDGDGWTPNQGDCNDNNDSVYPGAPEQPNGVDDDCDGIIDEGTVNYDDDGDGYSEVEGDCDDTNRLTFPGAVEVEDGEDNDCDDVIDEGTRAYDDDGDGVTELGGDCDDDDDEVHPGATESCNSKDDDCDSLVDEENSTGCDRYYADDDKDSYGDPGDSKCLCAAKAPYTASNASDCYDGNSAAKPGSVSWYGTHRGDGSYDYNCDGTQQKQYTTTFTCSGAVWICTSHRDGWTSGVPSCGITATWARDCSGTFTSCNPTSTISLQQTCR
jgi:hypothetical protein